MESAAMAPTYLPPTLGALPTTSTVSINVSPTKIPMNLSPNAASSPMTIPAPTTATYSPTAQSWMDLASPALVVSLKLLQGQFHHHNNIFIWDKHGFNYCPSCKFHIKKVFKCNTNNCEIEHTPWKFCHKQKDTINKMEKIMYRLVREKGLVLLSTSQAQTTRTFSQCSNLPFAQPSIYK